MPRKKIEIDQAVFENLCAIQCTLSEIAAAFGCSEDTIERWCKRTYKRTFADVFAEKRQAGRISLRRAGFKMAQKSAAVHIFYAKNYLGMSDVTKQEIEIGADGLLDAISGSAKTDWNDGKED